MAVDDDPARRDEPDPDPTKDLREWRLWKRDQARRDEEEWIQAEEERREQLWREQVARQTDYDPERDPIHGESRHRYEEGQP